jgi:hypothetical protein
MLREQCGAGVAWLVIAGANVDQMWVNDTLGMTHIGSDYGCHQQVGKSETNHKWLTWYVRIM